MANGSRSGNSRRLLSLTISQIEARDLSDRFDTISVGRTDAGLARIILDGLSMRMKSSDDRAVINAIMTEAQNRGLV